MLNWIEPSYRSNQYLQDANEIIRALRVVDEAFRNTRNGKFGAELDFNDKSVDEISALLGLDLLLLLATGGAQTKAENLKNNSGIAGLHQNWRPLGESVLPDAKSRNNAAKAMTMAAAAGVSTANHYGHEIFNPTGVAKSIFNQGREFFDLVGPQDLSQVRYDDRFLCNCGSTENSAGIKSTDCTRAIDALNSARGFKKTLATGSSALSLALHFVAPGAGFAVTPAKLIASAAADYQQACRNQLGESTIGTGRGANRSSTFDDVQICIRGSGSGNDPHKCLKIYLVQEKGTKDWFITPNENAYWLSDESKKKCMAAGCSKHFVATSHGWESTESNSDSLVKRHHCNVCGGIFCDEHTTLRLPVVGALTPQDDSPSAARRQKLLDSFFQEVHADTSRDTIYSRGDQATLQILEEQRVCVDCYTLACTQKAVLSSGLNTSGNNVTTLTTRARGGCKKAQAALLAIFHGNFAYVFASCLGHDRIFRIRDEIGT